MSAQEEALAAASSDTSRADLPAKAADQVEAVVSVIRDKTVTPVMTVVQLVVYGLIALFMLLVLMILISVAIVRVLDQTVFPGRVWASYTVLGGMWSGLGLFLLSRRNKPPRRQQPNVK
jgi:hypothetical protein